MTLQTLNPQNPLTQIMNKLQHLETKIDNLFTHLSNLNTPFMVLKPRVYKDGDQWCVLLGADLQEGISGFGVTPLNAVNDFNKDYVQHYMESTYPVDQQGEINAAEKEKGN